MVFTAAQKRAYAIRMAAARATAAKKAASASSKKEARSKKEAESKTRIPNTSHGTWRLLLHSRDGLSGRGRRVRKSFATAIGGPSFAELGKFLGHGAHKMLKSLTGFGDYVVNENSLMRLPIMNPGGGKFIRRIYRTTPST